MNPFLRSSLIRAVLLMAGVFSLFAIALSGPRPKEAELLIGVKGNSAEVAAKACSKIGRLEGKDKASGLFVVELGKGMTQPKAEQILKHKSEVIVVLPESARRVYRGSYPSVSNYVDYLNAPEKLAGPEDKEARSRADFYEAYKWYLHGRVNDQGYVDRNALIAANEHVAKMPVGRIGVRSKTPSTGTGGTWSFIGPRNLGVPYNTYNGIPPVIGRISAIAFDPTTANTIYIGGGNGGVWKSSDGGSTWACITDQSTWQFETASAIAVDPLNHNVIYVGTGDYDGFYAGYNQGVMKSTNGGATWTNVTPSIAGLSDVAVSRILVDPDNDNIVTITTGRGSYLGPNAGNGFVWRSTNAGSSWAKVISSPSDYSTIDVSISNGGNRTYWVAADGPILYRSVDQGATWTTVALPAHATEAQWTLATSKVSANTLYILLPATQKVEKTLDGGASWTDMTSATFPGTNANDGNWNQSTYDYYLGTQVAPSQAAGEVIFCGLITMCLSVDQGATWIDYGNSFLFSGATANMHSDQHQVAPCATNTQEVLFGNDGGLTKLVSNWSGTNPTITQTQLNANLGITQFYGIAPHPTDSTKILGGAQDNAGPASLGDLNNWVNIGQGDGGWCAWDLPENSIVETFDEGGVETHDLNGNFTARLSNKLSNGAFIMPTIVSDDGRFIFVGNNDLNIYDFNNPGAFSDLGVDLTGGGVIQYLATAPGDNNRIYSGANTGFVVMTKDLGQTYTRLDGGVLPQEPVGAITANPTNENDILVGFQSLGTGIHHLYRCANVLPNSLTWTNVSGSGATGLPDVPVNAIVFDPKTPSTTWYVGTDVGVFMTSNSGSTWSNVSSGLPIVQVFDLKAGNGYLYAGTYGRGIYRIQLDPVTTSGTLSNFYASPASVAGGVATHGVVQISSAAGTGGVVVSLSSPSTLVVVPGSVTVPAGSTGVSFSVTTKSVSTSTSVTLTATLGTSSKQTAVTLTPATTSSLSGFYASPASVVGGVGTRGVVQIASAAGTGGVVVSLNSPSSLVVVPSSATIPAGSAGVSFAMTTKAVSSSTNVTLTATLGSSTKQAVVTLTASATAVSNFYASPNSVAGGVATHGVVQISVAAGTGGVVVSLSSNNSAAVVPASVTVPAGSTGVSFTITTTSVSTQQTATLTAELGASTKTTTLTVTAAAPEIKNFYFSPSTVKGGTVTYGVVQLTSAAGPGGAVVYTGNTDSHLTVPATVTVPAGKTGVSFQIKTSAVTQTTTIYVGVALGSSSTAAPVTLTP